MQTLPAGGAEGIIASLVGRDEEGRSGKGAEDMIGVFYNRVGTINRDLSVLMANVLAEERLKERMVRKKRKRKRRAHTSPLGAPAAPDVLESSGDGGCNAVVSPEHIAEKPQHQSSGEEQMEEEDEGDEEDEEGLVILDAFAASGVRALRCASLFWLKFRDLVDRRAKFVGPSCVIHGGGIRSCRDHGRSTRIWPLVL